MSVFLLFLGLCLQSGDGEDFQSLLLEGRAALERKAYPEALEKLTRAAGKKPDHAGCQNSLGLAYFQLMDYSKARACFEKSLALDKTNPYTWTMIGHTYYLECRFVKAVQTYDKALALDPGYQDAAHFKAQLLQIGTTLKRSETNDRLLLLLLVVEVAAAAGFVFFLFRGEAKKKEAP